MKLGVLSTKNIFIILAHLSLILLAPFVSANEAGKKITVVYLGSDHPDFWRKTRRFANEVADDLGITLRFKTGEDRFTKLEAMRDLIKSENKPDYLIFSYTKNVGAQMMALADKANIPFILINTDIPEDERRLTLYPRVKYSNWLAHMHPNDEEAGYLLADFLVKKARTLAKDNGYVINESQPLKVVGVGGPSNHLPATLRNRGLLRRVATEKNAKLLRIATTNWQNSNDAVKTMFKSYGGVHVVWTAADRLALETWEAASRLGYTQGKDYVTGGIDWSPAGLDAVADGKISVSYGGHLMEAGWALILIHDYQHNLDFKNETGLVIKTHFSAATPQNVDQLRLLFSDNNWRKIDYRQFSKVYNPQLAHYEFNAEEMLRLFKNRQVAKGESVNSTGNSTTSIAVDPGTNH